MKQVKTPWFAIVTFGTSPKRTVFRSANKAIETARDAVGRGSCSGARVYQCETRELAKTADISVVRDGEQIVFG
ncbi:MAG: hypothetical protein ACO3FE_20595 [Planctomycetaceae bacterium]